MDKQLKRSRRTPDGHRPQRHDQGPRGRARALDHDDFARPQRLFRCRRKDPQAHRRGGAADGLPAQPQRAAAGDAAHPQHRLGAVRQRPQIRRSALRRGDGRRAARRARGQLRHRHDRAIRPTASSRSTTATSTTTRSTASSSTCRARTIRASPTCSSMERPFVVHGREARSGDYGWVDIDNYGNFYNLTRLMIANGHRRIAFINGDEHFTYALYRRRGVRRRAARMRGCSADSVSVLNSLHPMGDAGFKLTRAGARRSEGHRDPLFVDADGGRGPRGGRARRRRAASSPSRRWTTSCTIIDLQPLRRPVHASCARRCAKRARR